jgi:large subunit ribosomal protein L3
MAAIKGIIGRKVGMTRIFRAEGNSIPVTVIEAGSCPILQVKNAKTDGYNAVQLGFDEKRKKLVNKPQAGHYSKAKVEPKRFLREVPVDTSEGVSAGQEVKVDIFKAGERVKVVGTSKGLGFQGAVRRHHFRGGPKSHGQSDRLRAPGSVGSSSFPSRVFKGQRMAGRMGGSRVTVENLLVLEVDAEKNLLILKGAVPGKKNSILTILKH